MVQVLELLQKRLGKDFMGKDGRPLVDETKHCNKTMKPGKQVLKAELEVNIYSFSSVAAYSEALRPGKTNVGTATTTQVFEHLDAMGYINSVRIVNGQSKRGAMLMVLN